MNWNKTTSLNPWCNTVQLQSCPDLSTGGRQGLWCLKACGIHVPSSLPLPSGFPRYSLSSTLHSITKLALQPLLTSPGHWADHCMPVLSCHWSASADWQWSCAVLHLRCVTWIQLFSSLERTPVVAARTAPRLHLREDDKSLKEERSPDPPTPHVPLRPLITHTFTRWATGWH